MAGPGDGFRGWLGRGGFRLPAVKAGRIILLLLLPGLAQGYPLDDEIMGIRRLPGFRPGSSYSVEALLMPPGALRGRESIVLHLTEEQARSGELGRRDEALSGVLKRVLGANGDCSAVLLDYTRGRERQWAGVAEEQPGAPASVGKLLVVLSLFHELARVRPEVAKRVELLRGRLVAGGEWLRGDDHTIPLYQAAEDRVIWRQAEETERFSLMEWLDHLFTASSNAAANVVWKEALLMRRFGEAYPPDEASEAAFFRQSGLWEEVRRGLSEAMAAAELSSEAFRVGNFWTRRARERVPGGGGSTATARELARFLLRLEQGRLVDEWSSLEMKRLLYFTGRRHRFAAGESLAGSALYYKGGSLPGPRETVMNAVSLVESPARSGSGQRRYLVTLLCRLPTGEAESTLQRLGDALGREMAWP
ncbi:MAG: serine hydrolase [Magnetococcales bacterium]|nr:serine hydrolase [Magnetococcales bacterium]